MCWCFRDNDLDLPKQFLYYTIIEAPDTVFLYIIIKLEWINIFGIHRNAIMVNIYLFNKISYVLMLNRSYILL